MAYERLNLQNGDTLTAEHMAHIEDELVRINEQLVSGDEVAY
jgi:hypothetical protein